MINWLTVLGNVVAILVALGGLVFVFLEYRRSNTIKRAEFIKDLIDRLRGDVDIRDVIYLFQYDQFIYNAQFHGDEDMERKVDKALSYLAYICYLAERGIITRKEFSFFEIDVSQTLRNTSVIDYLFNLYHFECKVGGQKPGARSSEKMYSFRYLLRYGKKRGLINDSFYDPTNAGFGLYHHYLNY